MRKTFLTLGALACALTPIAGFAAVDLTYGTDPELDQKCSDLQKPSDASGYTSYAENIQVVGTPTVTTEQLGLISTVGLGTPTSTFTNFHGAHVNGQAVNIWAYGTETVTYPARVETYQTKVTTVTTRSASCHVHKPNPGNSDDPIHPDFQVAPQGLQTDEPVTATSTAVTYSTTEVTVQGPWVDPNASGPEHQVLICINPGKAPGTWRAMHGYSNQIDGRSCSRAWYDLLGSTPSNSLPSV